MEARVHAGYDSVEEIVKWNYIVDMARQTRIPLWQQREFIVGTLKKRKDNEKISQSTPLNHEHGFFHGVLHG